LWEAAKAEGIATERDRAKVREAADLLVTGEDHNLAGEALEAINDHLAAANAYSAGGLVERMEAALAKDDAANERSRSEADAHANYETSMRVGRRDEARAELARAVATATVAGEYRRMLDQLDTALLTAGNVTSTVLPNRTALSAAASRNDLVPAVALPLDTPLTWRRQPPRRAPFTPSREKIDMSRNPAHTRK
jgi:hypothetical protein